MEKRIFKWVFTNIYFWLTMFLLAVFNEATEHSVRDGEISFFIGRILGHIIIWGLILAFFRWIYMKGYRKVSTERT